ncbi:MAG: hypothetical protein HY843_02665 [Bdellovibrio sp.]|nr:hypothetical protein [Bdellovibrio sp.]
MGVDTQEDTSPIDPSTWTAVDGTGSTGINKDSTKSAIIASLKVFNSKLYATWAETNGAKNQIRVAVFNNSDTSPAWSFVDGNGPNGINVNTGETATTSKLEVVNSKLYIIFNETNAGVTQIRVKVYNGNDSSAAWSSIDGGGVTGINKDTTKGGANSNLIAFNNKLYTTWQEDTATVTQIRVKVYNDDGSTWSFVDGNGVNGLNKDTSTGALRPNFCVFNSKLYLAWHEGASQVHMRVYNGNDASPAWTLIDGGTSINKDSASNANDLQPVDFNSKLYGIWSEYSNGVSQIRAAEYNGNDDAPAWSSVDGNGTNGINFDTTKNATLPRVAVFKSHLYATWIEVGSNTKSQTRVAMFAGASTSPPWTIVDGNGALGLNIDTGQSVNSPFLVGFNSRLFAIWVEGSAAPFQVRIKAAR